MSRRYLPQPLSRRGQVVDLEAARAAIAQVAAQRDALAQQLTRAQAATTSLQHQLEARRGEVASLSQTIRALEASRTDQQASACSQRELAQGAADLAELEQRFTQLQEQAQQLGLARDEAVAERNRERAARKHVEAELLELRQARPEADRVQRLAADLANLRRHSDETIERGIRSETMRIMTEVASIHDTVVRALQTNPAASGPWQDGLIAIRSKVADVLRREGLALVGQVGERFDPAVHEAVGTTPGQAAGHIAGVVSSGLVLTDGTTAQPARVIVTA